MNFSGASASASSAVMTSGRAWASSARLRRCSISARASGLVKTRSGRRNANGSLLPSLPPSSRAIERHHHVGAGPGMIGQILDGLADAVLGARLRQDEREIGRPEQRMRPSLLRGRLVLAHESRLRLGHSVIVLDPVGQQERAAVSAARDPW